VKLARQEASITQAELARRTHVSRKWLSELENGKEDVNLGMVLRLLSELDYSLDLRRKVANRSESLEHEPSQKLTKVNNE
jgi:transcriptional regulator with XRE-family HTH domain